MRGIAKTFYVPAKKRWILRAIAAVKRKALAQFGTHLSDSDVIVDCVSDGLFDYRKVTPIVTPCIPQRRGGKKVELKRTVRSPESQRWLFERIEDIMEIKRQMGMKTSFSQEIVSLAALGLTGASDHAIILRRMLEENDKINKE
jgi:hypothetical protein